MKPVTVLQYVIWALFGVVILSPMLIATPIGGFGSLPFFGTTSLVFFLPVAMPILILLLIVTIVAGDDSTEWPKDGALSDSFESKFDSQGQTQPTDRSPIDTSYDGKDPIEILRDQYTNGEITHQEYERRLQLLLDADELDDLKERFEWMDEDPTADRFDDRTAPLQHDEF